MLKLLSQNKDIITDELRFLHEVYSVIDTFMELLSEGIRVTETEISVLEMPERRILLGGATDFSGESGFVREFIRFCEAPHKPKLNMSYPVGGYWDSMAAFLDEPSQPMRFFSLDPKGHDLNRRAIPDRLYSRLLRTDKRFAGADGDVCQEKRIYLYRPCLQPISI